MKLQCFNFILCFEKKGKIRILIRNVIKIKRRIFTYVRSERKPRRFGIVIYKYVDTRFGEQYFSIRKFIQGEIEHATANVISLLGEIVKSVREAATYFISRAFH